MLYKLLIDYVYCLSLSPAPADRSLTGWGSLSSAGTPALQRPGMQQFIFVTRVDGKALDLHLDRGANSRPDGQRKRATWAKGGQVRWRPAGESGRPAPHPPIAILESLIQA